MTVTENLETYSGGEKLSPTGFFNYVFNMDDESKGSVLNMLQYKYYVNYQSIKS